MSTVALFSAKGAPGATTTAMLLAALWRRPALLADCDPAGGDIGLRLPAPDGRPLDLGRGMLSLLSLARRSVDPAALVEHAQPVLGGGLVIAGLTGPEQAAAATQVWPTLAEAFTRLTSHDVVLDVGRLDSRSPVLPLVARADLAICVVDATVPAVYAARSRLRTLVAEVREPGRWPETGLIVHAPTRREADEIGAVLSEDVANLRYLGYIAHDPNGARMFDGRPVSRPERSMIVRSGREVAAAVAAALPSPNPMEQSLTGQSPAGQEMQASIAQPAVPGHRAGSRSARRAAGSGRRRAEQAR